MFNLVDYLISKGVDTDTANRIASKLSVQISSIDDFKNYTPKEAGFNRMQMPVLLSAGITFKED